MGERRAWGFRLWIGERGGGVILSGGRVGERTDLQSCLHFIPVESVGRACIRSNCDLGFPSASRLAGPKGTKDFFSLAFRLCLFLLFSEIFYPFKFEEFGHPLLLQFKHAKVRHVSDLADYVLTAILFIVPVFMLGQQIIMLVCWSMARLSITPQEGELDTSSAIENNHIKIQICFRHRRFFFFFVQHVKVVNGRTCQCYTSD
jgi:hypothetical protein